MGRFQCDTVRRNPSRDPSNPGRVHGPDPGVRHDRDRDPGRDIVRDDRRNLRPDCDHRCCAVGIAAAADRNRIAAGNRVPLHRLHHVGVGVGVGVDPAGHRRDSRKNARVPRLKIHRLPDTRRNRPLPDSGRGFRNRSRREARNRGPAVRVRVRQRGREEVLRVPVPRSYRTPNPGEPHSRPLWFCEWLSVSSCDGVERVYPQYRPSVSLSCVEP